MGVIGPIARNIFYSYGIDPNDPAAYRLLTEKVAMREARDRGCFVVEEPYDDQAGAN